MAKNRKRSEKLNVQNSQQEHKYPLPLPEVVNVDNLGLMSDEDLGLRFRAVTTDLNTLAELRSDAKPWEVELCYVRREQQIRRVRRDAHVEFLQKEHDWFTHSEDGLPSGNFDNLAFVYAATGGRQPRWN